MTDFKPGDKITVEFETVVEDRNEGDCICLNGYTSISEVWLRNVVASGGTVTVTVPAVQVFGPGSFVRDLFTDEEFLVLEQGYVNMDEFIFHHNTRIEFNSNQYERVEKE